MAAVPFLTSQMRRSALAHAAEVRADRAALKNDIHKGSATVAEVLSMDDIAALRMKVSDMISCLPGYGPIKTARLMEQLSISKTRRIQGLGSRQRQALIDLFHL